MEVDTAKQHMKTAATAFARAETALEEHNSRVAAHKRAAERNSAATVQAKDANQAQRVTWEEQHPGAVSSPRWVPPSPAPHGGQALPYVIKKNHDQFEFIKAREL